MSSLETVIEPESRELAAAAACFHCGDSCPDATYSKADKRFCCQGCLFVHELLIENDLQDYYDLNLHPGVKVKPGSDRKKWLYLDEPVLQERLLDFTDGKTNRITLRLPAIHCVACVWLLENLFRLHSGVGDSRVNFLRREASISFSPQKVKLSELVTLLCSLGYEPQLTLNELEKPPSDNRRKRQWLQVGVAGFAFGNIMLFSLPAYLGFDSFSAPIFRNIFGYLALALATPVLFFSASDYWRAAWLSLRQRVVTLDLPIALGLGALYAQSAYEIVSSRGDGYLDSMAGLVFFLLCGRMFQQKTHERIVFERDYKSFFPLSALRKSGDTEESVAISELRVGDILLLRNRELLPADARLLSGPALIDYSFVTGEAEPVAKSPDDYLYAGGTQVGGMLEVEIIKPVSQSYLTSLWNHETFQKKTDQNLDTLTNGYSRRFTRIVIGVALGSALFWTLRGDAARGMKAFTSVLIVACPCALALAAPFTHGTALRLLSRKKIFLKNGLVLERMAQIDTVVFDKTGTLTSGKNMQVEFAGIALTSREAEWVCSLARHSTHPHSVRICELLDPQIFPEPVHSFLETEGCGIEGTVDGHKLWLGSAKWLRTYGVYVPELASTEASGSWLAVDRKCRGVFLFSHPLRAGVAEVARQLSSGGLEIALLSGDNARESARFQALLGEKAGLRFNQTPLDKLNFIRRVQAAGKTLIMVGDGLNDAGALKQSDVGVAVVEKMGAFSPASDVIIDAGAVAKLDRLLEFSRCAAKTVRRSFAVSAAYNLAGISIAAAGILSPLICAILMPLSSLTVVLFSSGMTNRAARKTGVLN
ncbi:MAG TPA: heavy metal translocating P-type ATPase metal-binding domain-containing protein [Candidatus Dormibacteraeota bacterium]|nr:heavy metal translocating P-type ATPase metal-binding domain-containing protein [Candidatus Dormibacteraeota bacterium]